MRKWSSPRGHVHRLQIWFGHKIKQINQDIYTFFYYREVLIVKYVKDVGHSVVFSNLFSSISFVKNICFIYISFLLPLHYTLAAAMIILTTDCHVAFCLLFSYPFLSHWKFSIPLFVKKKKTIWSYKLRMIDFMGL